MVCLSYFVGSLLHFMRPPYVEICLTRITGVE